MGMHSLALQPYSSGFFFLSVGKKRFNLTKQMEVDWRRLFPLCRTWLCSTQEWERQDCSVSEWDMLSSWMGRSENAGSMGLPGLCRVDATLKWHRGISLKEYLHTLRVQNTCVSLQPPAVSGSTHTYIHRKLNYSWFLTPINTHLHTFPDWSVGSQVPNYCRCVYNLCIFL